MGQGTAAYQRMGGVAVPLIAAALALGGSAAAAQKNGLAFWEPDAAKVDVLLRANPKKDEARYGILRRSMVNLGCTGALMREQTAGKEGKNLICTLEGRAPDRILVITRIDDRGRDRPTWGDAVMLPMLYHALQAQAREHTFVFAALDGRDGEKAYIAELHASAHTPPVMAVVLDSLGSGVPLLHTEPADRAEAGARAAQTDQIVWTQATKIRQLMGIPDSALWPQGLAGTAVQSYMDWQQWLFGDALFRAVRQMPGVLIFSSHVSGHADAVNADVFHQDFDFVAWLLCGIDVKLSEPSPTDHEGAQPAAKP